MHFLPGQYVVNILIINIKIIYPDGIAIANLKKLSAKGHGFFAQGAGTRSAMACKPVSRVR